MLTKAKGKQSCNGPVYQLRCQGQVDFSSHCSSLFEPWKKTLGIWDWIYWVIVANTSKQIRRQIVWLLTAYLVWLKQEHRTKRPTFADMKRQGMKNMRYFFPLKVLLGVLLLLQDSCLVLHKLYTWYRVRNYTIWYLSCRLAFHSILLLMSPEFSKEVWDCVS